MPRTKSARRPNKTQGLMSQEVSKRCEESKVSVSKVNARLGLKLAIVAVNKVIRRTLESNWLRTAAW